jgi:tripartite-type tricarboxylate transporter receptor subunit TctC
MRSGKLRALGVTSTKRLSELPDVPAIADTLSGYELLGWAGFTVQAKTPREVVDMLHKAAVAALKRPDVAKRL